MVSQPVDFIALVYYRTIEEGGRLSPVFSKYRPAVKFPFSEHLTTGEQTFLNKEIVNPGETVEVEIRLISPQIFEGKVSEGDNFEVCEASKVVGAGKVIKIINQDLKAK